MPYLRFALAGAVLAQAPVLTESGPTAALPPHLAWVDVDVDGLPDLLARGPADGVVLLRNRGDGGFEDVSASYGLEPLRGVWHATWSDVDADGLPDLLVLDQAGRARLLRHLGTSFLDVTADAGLERVGGAREAHWLDYDRDGLADLLLVGDDRQILFHNQGELRFAPESLPAPLSPPIAAQLGWTEPPAAAQVDPATPAGAPEADDDRGRRPIAPGRSAGAAQASSASGFAATPTGTRSESGSISSTSCASAVTDLAGGPCLQASSTPALGTLFPLSVDLNLSSTGNVGLGTTAPLAGLHLRDQDIALQSPALLNESLIVEDGDAVLGMYSLHSGLWGSALTLGQVANGGAFTDKWALARKTSSPGSGDGSLHLSYGTSPAYDLNPSRVIFETDGDVGIGNAPGNNQLYVAQADTTGNAARFETFGAGNTHAAVSAYHNGAGPALSASTSSGDYAITANGKTGIFSQGSDYGLEAYSGSGTALRARTASGNTQPAALLQSYGDLPTVMITNFDSSNPQAMSIGGDVHIGYPGFAGLTVDRVVLGTDSTNAGFLELWNDLGEATIILDASAGGDGRITTEELVITGGADLVESFDTRESAIEPGSVVVIDAERPGELALSRRAYDSCVAGIVSGAGGIEPGLRMGQEGVASGDTLVALTGRVYVRASAENGAIRPGDRLTTAETPGHAMRATDAERSDGAVIGKAMSSLESGTGLVLVLVNLQ